MKELTPKPGTRSNLWKYFGLNPDSHGNMARNSHDVYCKTCRRKVQAENRITSNQKAHLKNNHRQHSTFPVTADKRSHHLIFQPARLVCLNRTNNLPPTKYNFLNYLESTIQLWK
uniref:BED-type domain-containing protein n=1 Tax=Amphimedon queenslandica TaxID=400682 RepID=A0A1X7U9U0_AMPQE